MTDCLEILCFVKGAKLQPNRRALFHFLNKVCEMGNALIAAPWNNGERSRRDNVHFLNVGQASYPTKCNPLNSLGSKLNPNRKN